MQSFMKLKTPNKLRLYLCCQLSKHRGMPGVARGAILNFKANGYVCFSALYYIIAIELYCN